MVAQCTVLYSNPNIQEILLEQWYPLFREEWSQGEHVTLAGPTGTGKTTVAHTILDCRTYVCVLAVKRYDDTLDRFRNGHLYNRDRYKVIKDWPPEYPNRKVIYWPRPKSITDKETQVEKLYKALNAMYKSGGWCVYFDEAGYIAGNLGLHQCLGVLLNQGRSSDISVVATMTRPRSMIARVPVETLNQCRHLILFKYVDEREIKACAEIAGISNRDMQRYMDSLQYHRHPRGEYSDFMHVHKNKVTIVRNTGMQNI